MANYISAAMHEFWDARLAYEKAVQRHGADSAEAKALKPRMDAAQKKVPLGTDRPRNK